MAIDHREGRHASVGELELVHDRRYIDAVHATVTAGGGSLDPDTIVSEGSWDAATAAAGCVLDAVDLAMDGTAARSFAAVRPPGHHALASRAMGFCLFGNVALAARYAQRRHGVERILIVDWDVHHGNGTQALVQDVPTIHFVSMHQWPWYPGTGRADDRGAHNSVWNVPLAAGLPADEYVNALLHAVDAATADFVPDIVLVSAGFDSMRGDPLGGFTLEPAHFHTLTTELANRADGWCQGRVVSALEGGYDPTRLAQGCAAHLRGLLGLPWLPG